ncbi:hypothetical protein NQ317_006004 [Molorchus minor]|uniref:Macro domain-containing protein n=1 Tax=Molorchus minor TaxID=1323400 RepID=A0ABQ9J4C9_9CUCU|nr:hypothetical protein NQ317_006004 [Molorchus minor]
MDEDIKSVLRNMMLENSGNLEEKMLENTETFRRKIIDNCVNLEERLENKLSETKQQLDQKIREIESQFALLSSKTDLSPPGAADEKCRRGKESPACSVAGDKEQHSIRHTTCETKMRMKPPQFDGKTPWPNYLRQFEAAAKTNDWSMDEKATALTLALRGDATDILQTLSSAEQADYEQLIKHLEMRYGQTNLEYVYHSQLKNRYQKPSETLKEFQLDISRASSSTGFFWTDFGMGETRQALILARPTNLVDALTRALEFEAAKQTEERVRVVLAEDSSISERCEAILYACPDGRYDEGSIMMVEPGTHDSEGGHGVVIGKSLSHVRKIVPVRVMNVNYNPVTLKKGTVLGYCCPVASIVRSLGTTRENSAEISAELEALIKTSRDTLRWTRGKWTETDMGRNCTIFPGEDIAGEDYVTTLRRRMDDIHDQVRSNIQSASDRMKETYDIGAQNDGYQSGDLVWLYNPQRRRGLSPKLQTLWEGPYEVLARINDVVYRIKKSSGGKPRVVHFNRLTPFSGSNDASVRTVVPSTHEMSFENFMAQYSPNHKARYGVTREEQRDLFQVPAKFALAHCVAQDLQMSRGIAAAFKEKFGNVDELRRQRPEVGDVLQLGGDETSRRVFYLVTKHLSRDKPTYENVWESLISLRGALLSQEVTHLAIPKLSCGLDGLNWRVVRIC